MLRLFIILQLFFLSLISNSFSQTVYFEGNITSDTTWNSDTVKITDYVYIMESATLTISPGTYIEFQGFYRLYVWGRLISVGNPVDTITFTINDTTGFCIDSNSAGGWGGIQFIQSSLPNDTSYISNCKILFVKSAAIETDHNSNVIIKNNVFSHMCTGVFCYESSPLISNNIFVYSKGMAIDCAQNSNPFIVNNYIGYSAISGIRLNESNPIISGNIIEQNNKKYESNIPGGGISCVLSSPLIIYNDINNNEASCGGGIYCNNSSPLIILNKICNNYSVNTGCWLNSGGGGIFCLRSSSIIINNLICNNTSKDVGGGIFCNDTSNIMIINNTVVNNTAPSGACIYSHWHANPTLINNIF
ncbi:MAG: right-handed parallel beta-helix repeat-containing protein [Bacteroidota bacterium]